MNIMKNFHSIITGAAVLSLVFTACHDDGADIAAPVPGDAYTIEAAIDNGPQTRAQVQYGTQDAAAGELFMWNDGDTFTLYDMTNPVPAEGPQTYTFTISAAYDETHPTDKAVFTCSGEFIPESGHRYLALYNLRFDQMSGSKAQCKLVTTDLSGYTQLRTDHPGNADLKHLQKGLMMYAFADTDATGNLPSLQFQHLTSIYRISLTNGTADGVLIHSINFLADSYTTPLWGSQGEYRTLAFLFDMDNRTVSDPDKTTFFFGLGTIFNDTPGQEEYTTIASGETYELYVPCIPVEGTHFADQEKMCIYIADGDKKSSTYANLPFTEFAAANNGVDHFERGKRYWFDLTIKDKNDQGEYVLEWTNYSPAPTTD